MCLAQGYTGRGRNSVDLTGLLKRSGSIMALEICTSLGMEPKLVSVACMQASLASISFICSCNLGTEPVFFGTLNAYSPSLQLGWQQCAPSDFLSPRFCSVLGCWVRKPLSLLAGAGKFRGGRACQDPELDSASRSGDSEGHRHSWHAHRCCCFDSQSGWSLCLCTSRLNGIHLGYY